MKKAFLGSLSVLVLSVAPAFAGYQSAPVAAKNAKCLPLSSPIPISGKDIHLKIGSFSAGEIPAGHTGEGGAVNSGVVSLGAIPLKPSPKHHATYSGMNVIGDKIVINVTQTASPKLQTDFEGYVELSAFTKAQIISHALSAGFGPSSPLAKTAEAVCVSGIAIKTAVTLTGSNHLFMGSIYVYLNGSNGGYEIQVRRETDRPSRGTEDVLSPGTEDFKSKASAASAG